ncbi:MAG: 2OG-Fe(II) oxygenase [Thiotrichaceae bacterium]|nr:2OG-Fe(II) oxygenase [Thiotrichaceae bacterium]
MEKILNILRDIERPGTFAVDGEIQPCLLDLEINQVGKIGLPIIPEQIEKIIPHCEQAPYGRGEETVLDAEVRSTWQIDAKSITIHNPQWEEILTYTVREIAAELGLGDSEVHHELYKMLIYGKDDFFTKHRDTEKIDNMFATLVIVLPSAHEGGELIVRHCGSEKQFEFGGQNQQYQIQYAAFYADCQHEVKPIQTGYRCCLIYNLALENVKKQPIAPNNTHLIDELSDLLNDYFKQATTAKLVLMLEHRYSQVGFYLDHLKNADVIKFDIMLEAAEKSNCDLHLAMLTKWESGDVGYDYYEDEDDAEMEEVFDSMLSIDGWITPDNQRVDFGNLTVNEEEVFAEFDSTDRIADEQEIEEATGNEGATMERWYHQAALVIWPQAQCYHHIAKAGIIKTIPKLHQMLFREHAPAEQCKMFAKAIIEQWSTSERLMTYTGGTPSVAELFKTLLETLLILDDQSLLRQIINSLLSQYYPINLHDAMLKLDSKYAWVNFEEELILLSSAKQNPNLYNFMDLLEKSCIDKKDMTQGKQTLCCELTVNSLNSLKANDIIASKTKLSSFNDHDYFVKAYRNQEFEQPLPKALVNLFNAAHKLEQHDLLNEMIGYYCAETSGYSLHNTLIPMLKELAPLYVGIDCPAYQKLYRHCVIQLQNATAQAIVKPMDWKQNVTLSCQCEDCTKLQVFLRSPSEKEYRFKVRKARRQHLHQEINKHKCDMTHETERSGSPQTLVCVKTYLSYERLRLQWEQDKALLAELHQLNSQS